MAALKHRVSPIRVRLPDRDLHTTRVRGVGYEAQCDCGWRSRRSGSWAIARSALREHKRERHGG